MKTTTIRKVPVSKLALSPLNARRAVPTTAEADELKASILACGVLQNLVVYAKRTGDAETFLVACGGRRLAALEALLRDGTITLEVCMALTLSDDHDQQIAVYERAVKHNPYGNASLKHAIRHALAEDRISTTSKLGRVIAVEDYEAAGGAMVRDLFSNDEGGEAWFLDPGLVRQLVQSKLDAKAEELRSEWKWVEAAIDAEPYRQGWARLHPVPSDPPCELTEEAERLDARAEELEAIEEDDWTDEIGEELDRTFERRDEIRREIAGYTTFTDEQRAASGCIVSLGYHGITVAEGILRPEDVAAIQAANEAAQAAAEEAADTCASDATDEEVEVKANASSIPPTVPGQPHGIAATAATNAQRNERGDGQTEEVSSDRPVHSQALTHDLDCHRHQILTAHIAGDYEAAFDLMLWDLCAGVLREARPGLRLRHGVTNLMVRPAFFGVPSSDLKESPAAKLTEAYAAELNLAWAEMEDDGEAFDALVALSGEDKRALYAFAVSRVVEHHRRAPAERIGTRLGVRVERFWRPTAERYWSKVRKDHALTVAREVVDAQWAHDHGGGKKEGLVRAMHTLFADGRAIGIAAEALSQALSWLPEGMGFAVAGDEVSGTDAPTDTKLPIKETEMSEDLPAFLTAA